MVTRSRNGSRIHTLRAEVEEMGADPAGLEQPADSRARGVTDDELIADLVTRDASRPESEQRSTLYPAERIALDRFHAEREAEGLPPGARPVSDLFGEATSEPLPVPRGNPAVWIATRDQIVAQAKRSTTKHAIGRPTWTPMPAKATTVDAAADRREGRFELDQPIDSRDLAARLVREPATRVHPERQPAPAPLPGRDALDTAARDHARWCDAPKVLASYDVAGRLDIASDPIEQAARRWLADPAAIIVVADEEQEQLVRDAVARHRQAISQAPDHSERGGKDKPSPHATVSTPPPAATEYARGLAALPPPAVQLDEPRVYNATAAYQEREGRRRALGLGSSHPGIEPDVEERSYVVAPVAPGSGWSYSDMTRALSVAASTHLISPEPNETTTTDAHREASDLRRSLAADQRAEQLRQAAMREEFADLDRRRARELEREPDRAASRR
jgi:hypothetical protein